MTNTEVLTEVNRSSNGRFNKIRKAPTNTHFDVMEVKKGSKVNIYQVMSSRNAGIYLALDIKADKLYMVS